MPSQNDDTGVKQKKNTGRSNLKQAWKPGKSGNPKGRPPSVKLIPELLREIAKEPGTSDGKQTKIEVVLRMVFKYAIAGKPWAVQFIADRMEGKVKENTEVMPTDLKDLSEALKTRCVQRK